MKKATILAACVVIVLGATGLVSHAADKPAKSKHDFTLTDQDGKKVALADCAGKIVVLEWMNPQCPVWMRHFKAQTMLKLAGTYKPKDVVWLAVNSTKSWDEAKNKAFRDKNKLPYPILVDQGGEVGRLFGAKTTPHMFILDKKHNLAYGGAIDDDPRGKKGAEATNHVAKALDELLAGKTVSTPKTKAYGCGVKYGKAPKPAKSKYNFTLSDQDGKKVALADCAGKIVVLEWMNSECPVWMRHFKAQTMLKLAGTYKPRGVVWFAVNSTKSWDEAKNKAYHDKNKLPYPILVDQSGKVGKLFGAKTTPHMFILDKKHNLAYGGAIDNGKKGDAATNYVAKALDELLAGKTVSTPKTRAYGCSVKYAK